MIRRLLDLFQQGLAKQGTHHPLRPNELRRDAVRAERLRREARLAEAASRQRTPPAREGRTHRADQPVTSPPQGDAVPLATALRSRSELRRAILLKEILGPPAALRWPRNETPEP